MKKYVLIFALIPTLFWAQNTVSGAFSPADEFTYAFLYHATPTSSDYINRAKIDIDGSFSIALDSAATPGIYKIVYAVPPENNNFDFMYNGKASVAFTFSLDNGLEFTAGQDNILWASYTKSMDMVNRTLSNFYTQQSEDKKAFADIIKTLKDTQAAYDASTKATLAHVFIKANTPYLPKGYEDLSTYSKNLKRTFLDHVDFSNPLLQSSDFLVDRVMTYIFGMASNTTSTDYKKDVDELMKTIGDNQTEIKTILYEMIWRRFKAMDHSELVNYITDRHLMALAKQSNYDALIEEMLAYKNNSVGQKATNFELELTKDAQLISTTLYNLDIAEQYLLIFWSSSCSHCLDELPKVKTLIAGKTDIKVIAIGLEDDAHNWKNKILEYQDFIHVLGLGKWENPTANAYGIDATPSYFILNKDKTITAKPYDFEALEKTLK